MKNLLVFFGLFFLLSCSYADDSKDASQKINDVVCIFIYLIELVVGAIASIVIIFMGLKYLMSGEDPEARSMAKNGIIAAFLGIIIIAITVPIVNIVGEGFLGMVDCGYLPDLKTSSQPITPQTDDPGKSEDADSGGMTITGGEMSDAASKELSSAANGKKTSQESEKPPAIVGNVIRKESSITWQIVNTGKIDLHDLTVITTISGTDHVVCTGKTEPGTVLYIGGSIPVECFVDLPDDTRNSLEELGKTGNKQILLHVYVNSKEKKRAETEKMFYLAELGVKTERPEVSETKKMCKDLNGECRDDDPRIPKISGSVDCPDRCYEIRLSVLSVSEPKAVLEAGVEGQVKGLSVTVKVGETVFFDVSKSHPSSRRPAIDRWILSYGDGEEANNAPVLDASELKHVYLVAGTYSAELSILEEYAQHDFEWFDSPVVTINVVSDLPAQPEAILLAGLPGEAKDETVKVKVGEAVEFDASKSVIPAGYSLATWSIHQTLKKDGAWTDDSHRSNHCEQFSGEVCLFEPVSYVYGERGIYTARLDIYLKGPDGMMESFEDSITVEVTSGSLPPQGQLCASLADGASCGCICNSEQEKQLVAGSSDCVDTCCRCVAKLETIPSSVPVAVLEAGVSGQPKSKTVTAKIGEAVEFDPSKSVLPEGYVLDNWVIRYTLKKDGKWTDTEHNSPIFFEPFKDTSFSFTETGLFTARLEIYVTKPPEQGTDRFDALVSVEVVAGSSEGPIEESKNCASLADGASCGCICNSEQEKQPVAGSSDCADTCCRCVAKSGANKPVDIVDDNMDDVLKSPLALVDFYRPLCYDCAKMDPVIDELAVEYAGRVYLGKFSIDGFSDGVPDEYKDMSAPYTGYGINSVPTFIIFKDGLEVERLENGKYSKADIETVLCKYLNANENKEDDCLSTDIEILPTKAVLSVEDFYASGSTGGIWIREGNTFKISVGTKGYFYGYQSQIGTGANVKTATIEYLGRVFPLRGGIDSDGEGFTVPSSPESFNVKLTVTDSLGAVSTDEATIIGVKKPCEEVGGKCSCSQGSECINRDPLRTGYLYAVTDCPDTCCICTPEKVESDPSVTCPDKCCSADNDLSILFINPVPISTLGRQYLGCADPDSLCGVSHAGNSEFCLMGCDRTLKKCLYTEDPINEVVCAREGEDCGSAGCCIGLSCNPAANTCGKNECVLKMNEFPAAGSRTPEGMPVNPVVAEGSACSTLNARSCSGNMLYVCGKNGWALFLDCDKDLFGFCEGDKCKMNTCGPSHLQMSIGRYCPGSSVYKQVEKCYYTSNDPMDRIKCLINYGYTKGNDHYANGPECYGTVLNDKIWSPEAQVTCYETDVNLCNNGCGECFHIGTTMYSLLRTCGEACGINDENLYVVAGIANSQFDSGFDGHVWILYNHPNYGWVFIDDPFKSRKLENGAFIYPEDHNCIYLYDIRNLNGEIADKSLIGEISRRCQHFDGSKTPDNYEVACSNLFGQ